MNLKSNNDTDKFKMILVKQDGSGGQERTVSIVDEENVAFDLEELRSNITDVFKNPENKEKIEQVFSLGMGTVGSHDAANGFVVGWIVNKILTSYESENGSQLSIEIEKTNINRDELMDYAINEAEAYLEFLKENKDNPDIMLKKMPTNDDGDIDTGIDQYK